MEKLPISVIIVARDAERTIGDCLSSVQRNNPVEIIVVDGNSSDRTVEIAKGYTSRIYYDEGNGLSYARQLGVEQAKQEYIAYVDSDIVLADGALATMLAEFRDSGYISLHARVSPNTMCSNYWQWAQNQHAQLSQSHHRQYIGMLTSIFRREVVLKYGFDLSSSARQVDDLDLELRLRKEGHKLGTSSAVVYRHWIDNPKNLVAHEFLIARWMARWMPHAIRKYGLWYAGFFPPLTTLYWLAFCLIKGKLKLIPYFVVVGTAKTGGMAKGFFELIGETLRKRSEAK